MCRVVRGGRGTRGRPRPHRAAPGAPRDDRMLAHRPPPRSRCRRCSTARCPSRPASAEGHSGRPAAPEGSVIRAGVGVRGRWKTSGHEPRPPSSSSSRPPASACVVSVPEGGLPDVAHWGAALGPLDADLARRPRRRAAAARRPQHRRRAGARRAAAGAPHRLDRPAGPVRVARRPGWSPRFTVTGVEPGRDARSPGSPPGAPGVLVVDADDDEAGLELRAHRRAAAHRARPLPRATRPTPTPTPYTLDDLVLAYPVPAEATSCSTSPAGATGSAPRSGRAFTVGTHLRENRKGRTGADSAYVLHAGYAGVRLRRRAGVGRAHGVERQPHPLRRAAVHRRAGARRRRAAAARRGRAGRGRGLREPLALRRLRRRASTRSPAASTGTCAAGPPDACRSTARSPSTSGRPSTSTTTPTG